MTPDSLALASWSVSLGDMAILVGAPLVVCVGLFVWFVMLITWHDCRPRRDRR